MSSSFADLVVGLISGVILFPILYYVFFTLLGAFETAFGWDPMMDIAKISITLILAIPTDLIAVVAFLQKL